MSSSCNVSWSYQLNFTYGLDERSNGQNVRLTTSTYSRNLKRILEIEHVPTHELNVHKRRKSFPTYKNSKIESIWVKWRYWHTNYINLNESRRQTLKNSSVLNMSTNISFWQIVSTLRPCWHEMALLLPIFNARRWQNNHV